MTMSLRSRYDEALENGRSLLDRMKRDASLLRAELRDAKDETLQRLEAAYDTFRQHASQLPREAGRITGAMSAAAHEAYVEFQTGLLRARAPSPPQKASPRRSSASTR